MSIPGRRSRSILQEINNYVPEKNKEEMFEMRAHHVISSAIFLFEMLEEHYTEDEMENLKKRFISSIKGNDPERFIRSIRKIKEGKNAAK